MKKVSVQIGLVDSTVMYTVAWLNLSLGLILLFGGAPTQNDEDEDDVIDEVREDETCNTLDLIEVDTSFWPKTLEDILLSCEDEVAASSPGPKLGPEAPGRLLSDGDLSSSMTPLAKI